MPGFQTPITISDAIDQINKQRLLLPAIQREFVWSSQKIEWLFDSLLQGYPIGSFLFWNVNNNNLDAHFRYYKFIQNYKERYNTHNPPAGIDGIPNFNAVLDGQQRLTAMYIGLTGTYAYKRPRVWWANNDATLPPRSLYLDINGPTSAVDNELGRVYNFKWLTAEEAGTSGDDMFFRGDDNTEWFLVRKILAVRDAYSLLKILSNKKFYDQMFATKALSTLQAVTHTHRVINYYLIDNSDMDTALNVFVRVNSGGEALSLSDMLMSTAIANWTTRDAKGEILGLVDQLQTHGFNISKDLILKSCLYLYSSDIRYKVTNFTASHVKPFEDNWVAIRKSITAVFELVKSFGYCDKSLTSKNALLPILYWVHHNGLSDSIVTGVNNCDDRGSCKNKFWKPPQLNLHSHYMWR